MQFLATENVRQVELLKFTCEAKGRATVGRDTLTIREPKAR